MVSKLLLMDGPNLVVFVNKTVLKHSHGHSFTYCLGLLLCYNGRSMSLQQRPNGMQTLKYLIFYRKTFANPLGIKEEKMYLELIYPAASPRYTPMSFCVFEQVPSPLYVLISSFVKISNFFYNSSSEAQWKRWSKVASTSGSAEGRNNPSTRWEGCKQMICRGGYFSILLPAT